MLIAESDDSGYHNCMNDNHASASISSAYFFRKGGKKKALYQKFNLPFRWTPLYRFGLIFLCSLNLYIAFEMKISC